MNVDIPRPEHPRPQLVRPDWVSLNGVWQFEIDQGDSGVERGLVDRELAASITVPFAPESQLSGIGVTDFLEAVWYRRSVDLPPQWAGKRVLLHFQAIDHDATVWVNGVQVARHRGGFTPFSADLHGVAEPGERITIVVRARDTRHGLQPRGKQSTDYANRGVHYTRTTGVWQTVWLEAVPHTWLRRARVTPDVAGSAFHLELPVSAGHSGWTVHAILSDDSGEVIRGQTSIGMNFTPRMVLRIPEERVRLWQPGNGQLYGLRLEVRDAEARVVDAATSYAGLRSVAVDGQAVLINGRRVFQRLVLDQGYWPKSLMTAPSESALLKDIELALEAGFNGARLHQKVFEERYLYHADRLGYLVWGELADWGAIDRATGEASSSLVVEWLEAVQRDYSHPSVIGWCPLNETQQPLEDRIVWLDDITRALFLATKASDSTRPVIDASGYAHRVTETDVYDAHLYEQDPKLFAERMRGLAEGKPYMNALQGGGAMSVPYTGQPYFCSEFGGIWWDPDSDNASGSDRAQSWGYGRRPADENELIERFGGLVSVLLENPSLFGYCYTQLTDTFQERNGVYRFDRSRKVDVARLRQIQSRRAAYERS
jgi:beta-galactosidase/beta-glucuronidase